VDKNGLVEQCIQEQMEGSTGIEALARFYVHQKALEKCESLDCEKFADCFSREAGLLALPPDQKRRLLRLVCEAIQDVNRAGGDASGAAASAKWSEMAQALEDLQNPALAAALLEEGRQNCVVANNMERRPSDRISK
jgi:hypothetical protein